MARPRARFLRAGNPACSQMAETLLNTCPAFSRAGARLHWPLPDPVEFSGNQDAASDEIPRLTRWHRGAPLRLARADRRQSTRRVAQPGPGERSGRERMNAHTRRRTNASLMRESAASRTAERQAGARLALVLAIVAVAESVALVLLPALRSLFIVYLIFSLALLGGLLAQGLRRGLFTSVDAEGKGAATATPGQVPSVELPTTEGRK